MQKRKINIERNMIYKTGDHLGI